MKGFTIGMALAAAGALGAGLMFTFEWPPQVSTQQGYRGLGMVQITSPRAIEASLAVNQVPPAQDKASDTGDRAGTAYQNVKVLGDLSVDQFNRVMLAITEWVAPVQGCTYCHEEGGDLASDKPYQKIVARRMIEMTRKINVDWKNHVAGTGVTCFTCHRGQPVPVNLWFNDPGPPQAGGMSRGRDGQNAPSRTVAYSSLPYDPLTQFLEYANNIRAVGTTALPTGVGSTIRHTEETYALMMNMSQGLGVNCTFCHNTRSFSSWDLSPPARATAWHGIRMVRDLNVNFLMPLQATFPAHRNGPLGDVGKIECATCHQGVSKPLLGAKVINDYPELAVRP